MDGDGDDDDAISAPAEPHLSAPLSWRKAYQLIHTHPH